MEWAGSCSPVLERGSRDWGVGAETGGLLSHISPYVDGACQSALLWDCVMTALMVVVLVAAVTLAVRWYMKGWCWWQLQATCASTCKVVPLNNYKTGVIMIKRLFWLADLRLVIPFKYVCAYVHEIRMQWLLWKFILFLKMEGVVYFNCILKCGETKHN